MKIFCPICGDRIPPARRSRKTNVAVCERCRRAFSARELATQRWTAGDLNLRRLPAGVWCDDRGESWRLGTPLRDRTAVWLIPAVLIWLFLALGLIFAVDEWESVAEFTVAVTLLLGLPAVWITAKATLDLYGRLIVSKEEDEGAVFIGLGRWGWTRRFRWSTVQAIARVRSRNNHPHQTLISLVGPRSLRFGGTLSTERQDFLVGALQTLLARPNAARKDNPRLGAPIVCPQCGQNSTLVHVDVEHNRAECTHCEREFALSELPEKGRLHFDLGHPPAGAWYEDRGNSWRVGSRLSADGAWVALCGGGLLLLMSSVPWIETRKPAEIFAAVCFTLLFAGVGLGFMGSALISLAGTVIVSRHGDDGRVFTGIGRFGFTRRFRWSTIRHVRQTSATEISLIGPRVIRFGGRLGDEESYYFLRALQALVADRGLASAPTNTLPK